MNTIAPEPQSDLQTVSRRLQVVFLLLLAVAILGFAYLGLELLIVGFQLEIVFFTLAAGLCSLVLMRASKRRIRGPTGRRGERWIILIIAVVLLAPFPIIATGSAMFFWYTIQMVRNPNYVPYGPPVDAPVGDLALSIAAAVGLTGLQAYAIFIFSKDY